MANINKRTDKKRGETREHYKMNIRTVSKALDEITIIFHQSEPDYKGWYHSIVIKMTPEEAKTLKDKLNS